MAGVPLSKVNPNNTVGLPINSTLPLQVGGIPLYTAPDDTVWLKSGWAETNFAEYPDADHSLTVPAYEISVTDKEGAPHGACMDSTHFYVVGYTNDSVHKYLRSDGSFVASFDLSGQDSAPRDIAWDGTNFYMIGGSNQIYKYDVNWVYSGSSVAIDAAAEGLTYDTTNETLWIMTNNGTFKEYDNMVYTGRTFSIGGTNNYGLGYDGTDFIVTRHNTVNPFKVAGDLSGAVTNNYLTVNWSYMYGFDHDPYSKDFIPVFNDGRVFMYVESIGMTAKTDSDTGLPIYLRIK